MRLYPENLEQHLSNGPALIYLIVGDEPLQRKECLDSLKKYGKNNGYETGLGFTCNKQFDWNLIFCEFSERSLFSDKQLIELELSNKPDLAVTKNLLALSDLLDPDYLLVITCPKLSPAQFKSKWFSTLEQKGIYIPVNTPDKSRLPAWVGRRLQQAGFKAEQALITPLCYHFEGNMLALDQAIAKLKLSYANGQVSEKQLLDTLSLDARFTSFQLVDALLLGKIKLAHHILTQLEAEGIEAIIIAWNINRELLLLLKIYEASNHGRVPSGQGQPLHSLFTKNGIWQQRQAGFSAALNRLSLNEIITLIQAAARLDSTLKTQYPDDSYSLLRAMCDAFMNKQGQALLAFAL